LSSRVRSSFLEFAHAFAFEHQASLSIVSTTVMTAWRRRPGRGANALGGSGAHAGAGAIALERCDDELAEERRGSCRARLELRVELARDEPRVIGQLDDLDETALLERPRDDEPVLDELVAVLVVDLVAVAVPSWTTSSL